MNNNDTCYKCGGRGHFARDCMHGPGGPTQRSGGFQGPSFQGHKCYKCSRTGHFARDCTQDQERCYKCNGLGHIAKDCEKAISPGACYNCGSDQHLQRECPQAIVKTCFRCNQAGHLARDCPSDHGPGQQTRITDDRKCYSCGGVGHMAKECPSVRKECYRMGGFGPVRQPRISRTIVRSGGPYRWAADNHRKEVKWN